MFQIVIDLILIFCLQFSALVSNSIDITARTTLTAIGGKEGWHIIRQNIWSVLSNYLLVMEYNINLHTNMCVKVSTISTSMLICELWLVQYQPPTNMCVKVIISTSMLICVLWLV